MRCYPFGCQTATAGNIHLFSLEKERNPLYAFFLGLLFSLPPSFSLSHTHFSLSSIFLMALMTPFHVALNRSFVPAYSHAINFSFLSLFFFISSFLQDKSASGQTNTNFLWTFFYFAEHIVQGFPQKQE